MTHELLLFLQDLRGSLPDLFTSAALFLSTPAVYLVLPLVLASVIYLCVDKRKGEWMMLNISVGIFISHFLKDMIRNPRPWVCDDRIHPEKDALKNAGGYSTPSGHSTQSVTGFGSLIFIAKRNWLTIILIAVMFFIIFSRLFLGVHTLFDVVLGALLAIAVMTVNWFLMKISYSNEHGYVVVTVMLVLTFIILSLIWYLVSGETEHIMKNGGFMLGVVTGRYLEHNVLRFEVKKVSLTKNILRCTIGLIVIAACFIPPYLALGTSMGYAIGGFLAATALLFICPALIEASGLNE